MPSFGLPSPAPTVVVIVLAAGITTGSMYVTASTASLNATTSTDAAATSEVSINNAALIDVSVELGAHGRLTGRLSGIEPATGKLSTASGVEVSVVGADGSTKLAVTAEDGTFQIQELSPGAYTINASSPEGSLFYGVRLVAGNDLAAAENSTIPVSRKLDLQFNSALAPARDFTALKRLLAGIKVTPVKTSPPADTKSPTTQPAAPVDSREIPTSVPYVGHQLLALNDNGSLNGRVSLLAPSTGQVTLVNDLTAYFISNNQIVAKTEVNPDGTFTQYNLLPGVYTMVIAGSDTIAYIGINVVGGFVRMKEDSNYIKTSHTLLQDGVTVGAVQGASPPADSSETNAPISVPQAAGGAGGGAAGGAGGGLEGLSLLMAAGGLGAGLAAAIDDDTVASPNN